MYVMEECFVIHIAKEHVLQIYQKKLLLCAVYSLLFLWSRHVHHLIRWIALQLWMLIHEIALQLSLLIHGIF